MESFNLRRPSKQSAEGPSKLAKVVDVPLQSASLPPAGCTVTTSAQNKNGIAAMKPNRGVVETVDLSQDDDTPAAIAAITAISTTTAGCKRKREQASKNTTTPRKANGEDATYGSYSEDEAGALPSPPHRPAKAKCNLSLHDSTEIPDSEATTSSSASQAPVTSQRAHRPAVRPPPLTPVRNNIAAATLPSPRPTPQKPAELARIPELADRYVPKYSLSEGVDFVNPRKFCTKPAFWRKWPASRYAKLAQELRDQFDPVPFARQHDIPVEEVQALFTGIIINPLCDAEEARRRGEKGIQELMELCNEYGTETRRWGMLRPEVEGFEGELAGVKPGAVVLTRPEGSKVEVPLRGLSEKDKRYLRRRLSEREFGMVGGENAKQMVGAAAGAKALEI